jgi:hypothetical protein
MSMWLIPIIPLLALSAGEPPVAVSLPAAVAANPASPAPIYTRQMKFAIPFQIARPDRIGQEPVEVQLHVSGDRGGHWDLYHKTDPSRTQFLFLAGAEGEY